MKTSQPFVFPTGAHRIGPVLVAVAAMTGMLAWHVIALAPYVFGAVLSVSFP
jgi:hypothetical protein